MKAFKLHFMFKFQSGIRNKTLLMLNYLFPLGFYLMMGFIMAEINPDFRKALIPAMTTFAVLAGTLLGIPDPIVNARENGVFRSYKINGVPNFSILIMEIFTAMVHLSIVGAIISISAPILFDAPIPINWVNFVLIFLALSFASAGLSTLIGVTSSNSRITVLWSQIFFLPSMLIGGLMFPYSLLPEAAQKVSLILPATHAMNAFSGLAMGTGSDFRPSVSILVMILIGLVSLILSSTLFKWDSLKSES
jgi:ABC-2 type transport system permease protein